MNKTQGRALIAKLKRKRHTYLEMLSYGISTSPWKRISECLADTEELVRRKGRDGLVRWSVVSATRLTA